MLRLTVDLAGNGGRWTEAHARSYEHVHHVTEPTAAIYRAAGDTRPVVDHPLTIKVTPAGITTEEPSVAILVDYPDGRQIMVCETSARLFCLAAKQIRDHYPHAFE